jgi:aspartate-semialdehyde dehydrogenase
MADYNVAIVGPGELAGQELIRLLIQRRFPLGELKLFDAPPNFMSGRFMSIAGRDLEIKEIGTRGFKNVDIAFFCGNPEIAHQFAPSVSETGVFVIDMTGAFRLEDKTPLIVPEINPGDMQTQYVKKRRIVASPSPTVIQLALPLNTFRQWTSFKRLMLHSFEPVSESGQAALEMFTTEVRQTLEGNKNVVPHLYAHQIAFNLLPETDNVLDTGITRSETRIAREVRRLWKLPDLNISVMCVRVPVFQGISQSVQLDFGRRVTPDEVREVLGDTPGVRVLDDATVGMYPHPWGAVNHDDVLVGRIRTLDENHNTLALWSAMDNIRRGNALNGIKIAEAAIELKLI